MVSTQFPQLEKLKAQFYRFYNQDLNTSPSLQAGTLVETLTNDYIQRNSSEYSTSSDDKVKVGPKIGFKKTAGKTVDKYNEYVVLVGKSRKGINAGLWSTTLRQAAQQEKMRIDKEKKENEAQENSDETTLEEVGLEHDYMEYTQINWDKAMNSVEAVQTKLYDGGWKLLVVEEFISENNFILTIAMVQYSHLSSSHVVTM